MAMKWLWQACTGKIRVIDSVKKNEKENHRDLNPPVEVVGYLGGRVKVNIE